MKFTIACLITLSFLNSSSAAYGDACTPNDTYVGDVSLAFANSTHPGLEYSVVKIEPVSNGVFVVILDDNYGHLKIEAIAKEAANFCAIKQIKHLD